MNTTLALVGPHRFAAYLDGQRLGEGDINIATTMLVNAVIERCAEACEQRARTASTTWYPHTVETTANECAQRIRALKGTP